jgi:hypothetical protein
MISGLGQSHVCLQQPGLLTERCRAFARIENHYFVNKVFILTLCHGWKADQKGFFPEDGHLIKEAQIAKM